MKVHGINTGEIQGYDELLQKHKTIFDSFILNIYNAQGIERRATLLPNSFNFVVSEQSLGKENSSDNYYIPLGTTITAVYADENDNKVLKKYKDKKYKYIPCTQIEKETYLCFEYQINGHEEWMHVLSGEKWF